MVHQALDIRFSVDAKVGETVDQFISSVFRVIHCEVMGNNEIIHAIFIRSVESPLRGLFLRMNQSVAHRTIG